MMSESAVTPIHLSERQIFILKTLLGREVNEFKKISNGLAAEWYHNIDKINIRFDIKVKDIIRQRDFTGKLDG